MEMTQPQKAIADSKKWEYLRFMCSRCHQEVKLDIDKYGEPPSFYCGCGYVECYASNRDAEEWEIVETQNSIVRLTHVTLCPVCHRLREGAGNIKMGYCRCDNSVKIKHGKVPMYLNLSYW